MQIKVLIILIKGVVGLLLTAMIGYIIKAEHKIDDVVDVWFASRKK